MSVRRRWAPIRGALSSLLWWWWWWWWWKLEEIIDRTPSKPCTVDTAKLQTLTRGCPEKTAGKKIWREKCRQEASGTVRERWRRHHKTELDGDKWSVAYSPMGMTRHTVDFYIRTYIKSIYKTQKNKRVAMCRGLSYGQVQTRTFSVSA